MNSKEIPNSGLLKKQYNMIKMVIYTVLFAVYILPTGLINSEIPIDKLIFIFIISMLYILDIIGRKKIKKHHLLFILVIITLNIVGKTIDYFLFLPILFLDILLEHKEEIKEILNKSSILYICLAFTILYSLINFGKESRYVYTAIMEINQSGLAIFCLALLIVNKNKKIGYFVLILGLLTVSRSYYLAVIIYIMSHTKFVKAMLNSIQSKIKYINYFNITVISSFILIGIAYLYLYEYSIGNVFWGDEISNRLINLFDYSNLFRFLANLIVILFFVNSPMKMFVGVTREDYISFGRDIYSYHGIPYKYTTPHNLFFSHLKMYGVFTVIEIIFVSNILKKITNKNNFMIYIAIVTYSIILGAGLYSYWLYLSALVLVIYEDGGKYCESSTNR